MDNSRVHYMRCPYCGKDGGHTEKVAKSVGLFRVQELYDNVLIMKCRKCGKVCRRKAVGAVLKWEDMTPEERKVFKKENYVSYSTKS